jgi:hypothetical protein
MLVGRDRQSYSGRLNFSLNGAPPTRRNFPHPPPNPNTMAATFSDAAMEQAAAALQTSQAYQASRGEKLLNRIGMWLSNLRADTILTSFLQATGPLLFQRVKLFQSPRMLWPPPRSQWSRIKSRRLLREAKP